MHSIPSITLYPRFWLRTIIYYSRNDVDTSCDGVVCRVSSWRRHHPCLSEVRCTNVTISGRVFFRPHFACQMTLSRSMTSYATHRWSTSYYSIVLRSEITLGAITDMLSDNKAHSPKYTHSVPVGSRNVSFAVIYNKRQKAHNKSKHSKFYSNLRKRCFTLRNTMRKTYAFKAVLILCAQSVYIMFGRQ